MDKLPPQNIEFEKSILASCLLFKDQLEEVVDALQPHHFYNQQHQVIYQTVLDLHNSDNPVDITSVCSKLKADGNMVRSGGASYIAELTDEPVSTNPLYFASKIVSYANLRAIIQITNKYMGVCFESPDVDEVIDGIQSEILSLGSFGTKPDFISVKDLVFQAMDRYEALQKRGTDITGITSGFLDMDTMTCGFQKSDLILLAARPSMGKTAFAINSMLRSSQKGNKCAIFSLEMSNTQLLNRMVAILSKTNSMKFRSGKFSNEDWIRISACAGKLHGLPIFIDDTPSQTFQQIIRKVRRLKKSDGVDVVFIDYLGFVRGDSSKNKVHEVGEISRALKGLAKELDIPVVLLCQLNRQCEQRENKRPRLSDLRESGDLEQDADVIMFLYRHEQYLKPKPEPSSTEWKEYHGVAEIEIAKQRNGPTGTIRLVWDEDTTEFHNYNFRG